MVTFHNDVSALSANSHHDSAPPRHLFVLLQAEISRVHLIKMANQSLPQLTHELNDEALSSVREFIQYMDSVGTYDRMSRLVRSQPVRSLYRLALATTPTEEELRAIAARLPSRFFSLATCAFTEAATIPETPPPSVWAPGDPLNSYYEVRLYQFQEEFRKILERQGNPLPLINPIGFRNEWLVHARSIMDNIRAEWGQHEFGALEGWKTTANTPNSSAAAFALQIVMDKTPRPAPADWADNFVNGTASVSDLHMFLQLMLARFEMHMERKIREEGHLLGMSAAEISEATKQYMGIIVKEYRKTWVIMFGEPSN
ncbi:hypothetical protein VTO42DRAFT_2456 [Malbranchea cinnamomea]